MVDAEKRRPPDLRTASQTRTGRGQHMPADSSAARSAFLHGAGPECWPGAMIYCDDAPAASKATAPHYIEREELIFGVGALS